MKTTTFFTHLIWFSRMSYLILANIPRINNFDNANIARLIFSENRIFVIVNVILTENWQNTLFQTLVSSFRRITHGFEFVTLVKMRKQYVRNLSEIGLLRLYISFLTADLKNSTFFTPLFTFFGNIWGFFSGWTPEVFYFKKMRIGSNLLILWPKHVACIAVSVEIFQRKSVFEPFKATSHSSKNSERKNVSLARNRAKR